MPQLPLAGITVALPASNELPTALTDLGARVIAFPVVNYAEPESYDLLDQAIENLFGYDWLVFRNPAAARYFLERFADLGRAAHEFDNARLCACDNATALILADAHIHVDIVPPQPSEQAAFDAICAYLGGREHLHLLNFLLPGDAASRSALPALLNYADARADAVPAYRAASDTHERARLATLLNGGGVDCAAFPDAPAVAHFAQLFDTYELDELLEGVIIARVPAAESAANAHGLNAQIVAADLAAAIAAHFAPNL